MAYEVSACRNCGAGVYLEARIPEGIVGGTGPGMSESWRHIAADDRYCLRGNGHIAEPDDGSGWLANRMLELLGPDRHRA